MLKGEAKKIYQRNYMRKRRAVRPLDPVEAVSAITVLDQTLEQLHDYSCRLEKVNDTIGEVAETMKKIKKPVREKSDESQEPQKEMTLILETKICPACGGKGYREFEHGLIRIQCAECKVESR